MIETKLIQPGEEPEHLDVPAFMATKKGWYVNTPTLFGVAHVPARKEPAHLGEVETTFKLNDTALPKWLIKKAHDLFSRVWEKQKTEAMVYIVHHPVLDRFNLWVPEQYVTGSSVSYRLQPGQMKGGWQAVGTIHSHCNFGAFHSGTDDHDMDGMPGIHITIGHVDRDWPEFAIALSVNKQKFDVDKIESIWDETAEVDHKGYDTAPDWWLDLIKTGSAPWTGSTVKYSKGPVSKTQKTKYNTKSWDGWDWTSEIWENAWGSVSDDPPKDVPKLPSGYEQTTLLDEEEKKKAKEDPFEFFEEELKLSYHILNGEAVELAGLGFKLQYSITYDPEAADQYLGAQLEKEHEVENE